MLNYDGCNSYNNLTHHRNIGHGKKDDSGKYYNDKLRHSHVSPDWQGAGWYRFTGPSGYRMPTKTPGVKHCGTLSTGWLKGNHPKIPGQTVNAKVCFHSYSNECAKFVDVEVTNCDEYFVYYLPDTRNGYYRYCATNESI